MNDTPNVTIEAPDEQVADIIQFPGAHPPAGEVSDVIEGEVIANEPTPTHSILEVWKAVLLPARQEATKRTTPQWASRIVATYSGVTYAGISEFVRRYYEKQEEMLQILLAEIETDDQAFTWTEAEEDAEHNAAHYKALLFDWQKQFVKWDVEWDCDDPHAAEELAAISEIHAMFFSDKGICAYLDNIKFQFTEDDQAELARELEALKEEK